MAPVIILTENIVSETTNSAKPILVHFDGDYADMWSLLKFRKVKNAAAYIKASEFRTKYVALVQASEHGQDAPVIIPVRKPKRVLYHYMLIKMLLLELNLLELESTFACHWDMEELPMLEKYQFDYWDIRLTIYNKNMTARPPKIVRLFQRRCDQWFNLTAAAIEYDGDDVTKKYVSTIANKNSALFEQLEAIEAAAGPKSIDGDVNPDKKLSAAEKKAIAAKYVDTTWSRHETWCHPIVFDDTMMSLFWDWRMRSLAAITRPAGSVARREILMEPVFECIEYCPHGPPANTEPESEDDDFAIGPA